MDKNEPNHKIKMGRFYKANNSIRPKELSLDGKWIKKSRRVNRCGIYYSIT